MRESHAKCVRLGRSAKAAWKLVNFLYPTLPLVSFGRDTKIRWSLLSGVYARGSKRSHTGGNGVTCHGLHVLPGQ